jgi:hypothetical protein
MIGYRNMTTRLRIIVLKDFNLVNPARRIGVVKEKGQTIRADEL